MNIHCGESKNFLYQIARNFPMSYAYARIFYISCDLIGLVHS